MNVLASYTLLALQRHAQFAGDEHGRHRRPGAAEPERSLRRRMGPLRDRLPPRRSSSTPSIACPSATVCPGSRALLLADWQIGVGVNLHSGGPFNVIVSGNPANTSRGTIRPNLIGDPNLPADERSGRAVVQHAAFTAPAAVHVRERAAKRGRRARARSSSTSTSRSGSAFGGQAGSSSGSISSTSSTRRSSARPAGRWARRRSAPSRRPGPPARSRWGCGSCSDDGRRDFLVPVRAGGGGLRWLRCRSRRSRRCAARCAGTSPLTITAIEPIVIRAPREGAPPEGPARLRRRRRDDGREGAVESPRSREPLAHAGVRAGDDRQDHDESGDLIGWGECHAPVAPRMQARIITDLFRPLLVGQDARQVEALWQRMY